MNYGLTEREVKKQRRRKTEKEKDIEGERQRRRKTEREKDREGERQRCKQWYIDEKGYFGCLLWKWITFKVLLLGWASFVDTYMSVHSATGGHVLPVVRDRFTLCPDTDTHMDSMHEIKPSICLATILIYLSLILICL